MKYEIPKDLPEGKLPFHDNRKEHSEEESLIYRPYNILMALIKGVH